MANYYHQISLKESFSDCRDMFVDDAPSFFQIMEQHFDISSFIPASFYHAYYQHLGRKRAYPLTGFLFALILQKIFSIPSDALLILFLKLCKELRDFCGFSKIPDASLFTRFKQDFEQHIELMFRNMVDFTEPICQKIDASLANILTFDTSGIELYVTENNPKTLNALIKRLKVYYNCHEEGRADRDKWSCPKVHMVNGEWVCDCENPCSTAKKGRTAYTYENLDFRMFPGIQRDSEEWLTLYKIRTIVERAINHLKINMCVAGRKSRNHATTKADVFLAGIASQLTVIVAHNMSYPQYIRSLKPLIA